MTATPISLLARIIKRDGSVKPFDAEKIQSAIVKAGRATGEFDEQEAARLTNNEVLKKLLHLGTSTPHIEQIQDAVECGLYEAGHKKTLRAYIVYREQHQKLRTDKQTLVDVEASMTEYLQQLDWRVNANANQGYSLGGLILNVSGKVIANYWLNHVYPPEVGEAHRTAAIHVHDLDMLAGYCAGWSLRTLLHEGLNGCARQGGVRPTQAHVQRHRTNRQLPRHPAKRMGGCAGIQFLRHLHGALRAKRITRLSCRAPAYAGTDL